MKKLPGFLKARRSNAEKFIKLFENHPDFYIQKDLDNSSWFGFSLIIKPGSVLQRSDIIAKLDQANIECRPIVTGNFTRNEVMKYFDYEIHGELKNADHLDKHGFFVGNHHFDLEEEINYLFNVLNG